MRRWHGVVGAEYGRKPGAIAAKTGTVTIKLNNPDFAAMAAPHNLMFLTI